MIVDKLRSVHQVSVTVEESLHELSQSTDPQIQDLIGIIEHFVDDIRLGRRAGFGSILDEYRDIIRELKFMNIRCDDCGEVNEGPEWEIRDLANDLERTTVRLENNLC